MSALPMMSRYIVTGHADPSGVRLVCTQCPMVGDDFVEVRNFGAVTSMSTLTEWVDRHDAEHARLEAQP